MTSLLSITIDGERSTIKGPLTRTTLSSLDKNAHENLLNKEKNSSVIIDLNNIGAVDTAGLAWLILLLETAQHNNTTLSFINLPSDLLKLAQLSAVDTFISH